MMLSEELKAKYIHMAAHGHTVSGEDIQVLLDEIDRLSGLVEASKVIDFSAEIVSLTNENDRLRARVKELEAEIATQRDQNDPRFRAGELAREQSWES